MALSRAQRLITEVARQFGGKYVGWDRTPAAKTERSQVRDDDGDDSDSPMGPPLPVFS